VAVPSANVASPAAPPRAQKPAVPVDTSKKDRPAMPSRNFLSAMASRRGRRQPSLVDIFKKHGLRDEDATAMMNGFLRPKEKMLRALCRELNMSFDLVVREKQRQRETQEPTSSRSAM
jgi:hypothetical protein